MIKIYITNISRINTEEESVLRLLSHDRREQLKALLPVEKKKQCAAAGLLLRHAFTSHGLSPDTAVHREKNGKPYCDGMKFSLSHSGSYALCAVADSEVGADIEKINPTQSIKTAKKICTDDELCGINIDKFFRIFTAKESYLKMTGEGLSRDMSTFQASEIENLQTMRYHGYMISVCTETPQCAQICPVKLF